MSRYLKSLYFLLIFAVACQPIATTTSSTSHPIPTEPPTHPPAPTDTQIPTLTKQPSPTETQVLPTKTHTPIDIAGEIDIYLNSLVDANEFVGAVLVAHENQMILSKGYGFSNQDQEIPNSSQTKFRICSITKQFTAMGILLLQNQGKLSVKDPFCNYISDCPITWEKISIHKLLVHTSGIPDFTDLPDYENTKHLPTTPRQLIVRFRDEPLQFDPGAMWRYSNSGYLILGSIIEQVSGQTYDAFIQEYIFDILQMDDSGYDHNLDIIATGYKGTGDRWNEAEYIDASVPYAAGALYSTVKDMYLWDQALYSDRLIPKELLDVMFSPYVNSPIGDYGYGWFITEKHNRRVIRHGGGGDGFITLIERYPDHRATFIVLSNRETTDIVLITDTIAKMVFRR